MQEVDKIFEEVILRIYLFLLIYFICFFISDFNFLFIFKVFPELNGRTYGGVGERCPEGNIVLFLEKG